jgi:hypothetical protein
MAVYPSILVQAEGAFSGTIKPKANGKAQQGDGQGNDPCLTDAKFNFLILNTKAHGKFKREQFGIGHRHARR